MASDESGKNPESFGKPKEDKPAEPSQPPPESLADSEPEMQEFLGSDLPGNTRRRRDDSED